MAMSRETRKMMYIWSDMKRRCLKKHHKAYKNYGARGISVCDRWLSFESFLFDMGYRPENKSMDRIDNDGDYSPENCRWVDRKTQNNNRRMCRMISFGNRYFTLKQIWEKYPKHIGVTYRSFHRRISNGCSLEKALFTPPQSGIKL